jgi:O-antigen/teichoic acid export membrane protein
MVEPAALNAEPAVPSLRRSATSGVIWTAVQYGGSRLTTLLVFLVLTHLMAPSTFGTVALASVFIALFQLFVQSGFGVALVQRKEVEDGHRDTVFWFGVGTGIVLCLVLIAISHPLAAALGEPPVGPVLDVLSVTLVISALGSTHNALMRRDLRFKSLAARGLVANVAGGIAGITAAVLGAGVWSLVVQNLVLASVQTTALWLMSPYRPGLGVSRRHFLDIFAFSRNSLGNSLLIFTNQRSDDFLVGSFLGSAVLGIYTIAYRLLTTMQDLVNGTLSNVALPIFSRLQGDSARLTGAYSMTLRLSGFVALPSYLFFVVAAPDVVQAVFGSKWHASGPVMSILALFGAAQTPLEVVNWVLLSIGRPQVTFRLRLLNTSVQVAAFLVAVPFGIRWVAATLVFRAYALAPLSLIVLRRATGMRIRMFFAALAAPAAGSLVMMGTVLACRHLLEPRLQSGPTLVILVAAGSLSYVAVAFFTNRAMLMQLLGLVRRRGRLPA